MKKEVLLMLTAVFLTACGSDSVPESSVAESALEESVSQTEGKIEVDEKLFNVEITIPKDYFDEGTSQESLDQEAQEKGYKSVTLNDDGSATYVMTKAQHDEMMEGIANEIKESISEMIGSEDYPNITDISYNDDYTHFTVTTKSSELNLTESFSVIAFYAYGGLYNTFNGTPTDSIQVDFVNADSGEIISSANSADSKAE